MNRSDSRARLALTIVLVLIAVVFIQKTAKPYHMGRQARAEAQELAGQVEELKRQNEISEQRLEALQSERGIEIEARKHVCFPRATTGVRCAGGQSARALAAPGELPPTAESTARQTRWAGRSGPGSTSDRTRG